MNSQTIKEIIYSFFSCIRGAFALGIALALLGLGAFLMGEFFDFLALQLGMKKTDGLFLFIFAFALIAFIVGSFVIGNEITYELKKYKRRKRLWAAMTK